MTVKSKLSKAVGGGSSKAIDISNKVIGILKNNPTLEPIVKKGKLSRVENIKLGSIANKNNIEKAVLKSEAKKLLKKFGGTLPVPTKKPFKSKKPNPPTEKDKGSNKGLSPSERREKAAMVRQSRAEIKRRKRGLDIDENLPDAPGGRQEILIDVPGTGGRRQRQVADPQNRLKGAQKFSAKEMEHWTPAEIEAYNRSGFGGSASAIREEMGSGKRSGKGVGDMDTQSKKSGGTVKRNMGGKTSPRKKTVFRRGGGKALRGFGKATYTNKLY